MQNKFSVLFNRSFFINQTEIKIKMKHDEILNQANKICEIDLKNDEFMW